MLKWVVVKRGKFDVRAFAFWWNTSLSLFSWCGVAACVPVLATTLVEHGLYFTTCAPAAWYCSAVVAPLDGAALLLALLLGAHRHGCVVCVHELQCTLSHVRLLCGDGDKVPQEGGPICHLHHLDAVGADARGHVRHDQGGNVPGGGRGVPCEQDKLRAGLGDVCQLLCALLQALCGQLLLEAEDKVGSSSEAA